MSATPRISLTIRRGDSETFSVPFKDGDGAPIDVSSKTFAAQLRATQDATEALADFDVDDTDADTGLILLNLDAATTALLPAGTTVWMDLQETEGDAVNTVWEAKVKIEKDVTRG